MKNGSIYIFYFSILFIVFACNKTEQFPLNYGYEYYPLHTGNFVTYQVDSFIYSDASYPLITIDTISFQMKEYIDSSFKDNENRDAYQIIRYRRPDASSSWQIDRIWTAVNTNNNLIKNEDDLHFIKLVFPIANNLSWAGNSLIVTDAENEYLKNWLYTYKEIDQPLSINSFLFDSTITVKQIDEENLIEKKYVTEQYAKNIGMVFKEEKFLGKQRNLSNGWGFPETGIWVRTVIIDHN